MIGRLPALTGCRRSEVLDLRWRDIGSDTINLPDSKTVPRVAPLGKAARTLIETMPGPGKPEAFLFPNFAHGKGYYPLRGCWRTVCEDAKLGRLRLHDLRHTAANQAVMAGENLPMVGKLLGTAATVPRQAMHTWPAAISPKPLNASAALSPKR